MYSRHKNLEWNFGFIGPLLTAVSSAITAGTQIGTSYFQSSAAKDIAKTQSEYALLASKSSASVSSMLAAQGILQQQQQEAAQAQTQIAGIPVVYLLIGGGVLAAIFLLRGTRGGH